MTNFNPKDFQDTPAEVLAQLQIIHSQLSK